MNGQFSCKSTGSNHGVSIIESVDSVCRDSVDTQYMIQKISQNLQNIKVIMYTIHLQVFSCATKFL